MTNSCHRLQFFPGRLIDKKKNPRALSKNKSRFSSRFDSEGQHLESASISSGRGGLVPGGNTNWKTLQESKEENLGQGDKVRRGPRPGRGGALRHPPPHRSPLCLFIKSVYGVFKTL